MKHVLEYLECSSRRTPSKVAFADRSLSLTFQELERRAAVLGTSLARQVARCNRPLVVLVERNVYTLAGFLGVLKSGNYYVPLDPLMPSKRLQGILEQVDPALILYSHPQEKLARALSRQYPICSIEEHMEGEPDDTLLARCRSQVLDIDPVYMIFTSGSTGTPKGIVISHRSVIDFVEWMAENCRITKEDVMGNQAPFYFDLSVKDIYLTLKCGASCYILEKKLFLFPGLLVKELEEKAVTTLIWATSAFHLVANSGALEKANLPALNKVIVGGEALRAKQLNLWRNALPHVQYTNLYGPTEVTVDCTWYPITREFADHESIPIGTACANKEVFLLDRDLKPVADGQPGELCVRGVGLAHGYFKDPEKTAAAFIQDPRNADYPQKIYRTGDLAYRNEEGLFVFLSRKDGQIKHMGYRIELGEVETALAALPDIQEAITFFDEKRDKIVCCYAGDCTGDDINRALKEQLPKYMLPNLFRPLPGLPHNPNGKVDRVSLREQYEQESH